MFLKIEPGFKEFLASGVAEGGQMSSFEHFQGDTVRHLKKEKKGQSLIEYAVIVSLVSLAMVAMSTYVFRFVQATQKMIEEEFANN